MMHSQDSLLQRQIKIAKSKLATLLKLEEKENQRNNSPSSSFVPLMAKTLQDRNLLLLSSRSENQNNSSLLVEPALPPSFVYDFSLSSSSNNNKKNAELNVTTLLRVPTSSIPYCEKQNLKNNDNNLLDNFIRDEIISSPCFKNNKNHYYATNITKPPSLRFIQIRAKKEGEDDNNNSSAFKTLKLLQTSTSASASNNDAQINQSSTSSSSFDNLIKSVLETSSNFSFRSFIHSFYRLRLGNELMKKSFAEIQGSNKTKKSRDEKNEIFALFENTRVRHTNKINDCDPSLIQISKSTFKVDFSDLFPYNKSSLSTEQNISAASSLFELRFGFHNFQQKDNTLHLQQLKHNNQAKKSFEVFYKFSNVAQRNNNNNSLQKVPQECDDDDDDDDDDLLLSCLFLDNNNTKSERHVDKSIQQEIYEFCYDKIFDEEYENDESLRQLKEKIDSFAVVADCEREEKQEDSTRRRRRREEEETNHNQNKNDSSVSLLPAKKCLEVLINSCNFFYFNNSCQNIIGTAAEDEDNASTMIPQGELMVSIAKNHRASSVLFRLIKESFYFYEPLKIGNQDDKDENDVETQQDDNNNNNMMMMMMMMMPSTQNKNNQQNRKPRFDHNSAFVKSVIKMRRNVNFFENGDDGDEVVQFPASSFGSVIESTFRDIGIDLVQLFPRFNHQQINNIQNKNASPSFSLCTLNFSPSSSSFNGKTEFNVVIVPDHEKHQQQHSCSIVSRDDQNAHQLVRQFLSTNNNFLAEKEKCKNSFENEDDDNLLLVDADEDVDQNKEKQNENDFRIFSLPSHRFRETKSENIISTIISSLNLMKDHSSK